MSETSPTPEPTVRQRRWLYRLRIATAASFFVLCAVFVVMWLHSRDWCDELIVTLPQHQVSFTSWPGHVLVSLTPVSPRPASKIPKPTWDFHRNQIGPDFHSEYLNAPFLRPLFVFYPRTLYSKAGVPIHTSQAWGADCPYWLLLALSAPVAVILAKPRPWRFSLRGFLIAMAYLAVVMGTTVWLYRSWYAISLR
jgi:hypothetical protein